jgi:UDP-N-acetylglucosamine:LPS N-acetylglucosamine transferase
LTRQLRVVVASAAFGGGYGPVAEALADQLRRHRGARVRVASLDLLGRCAPRSAKLAALAYRGGEEFFPHGSAGLSEMAARAPEDPLLRELVGGGIASAEAALAALEPDLVLAVHPVAGAIAAEAVSRLGFPVMSVIGDLWPRRVWLHPGVGLWFVGGSPARDALAALGVEWARLAVSGVPVPEPADRQSTRSRLQRSRQLEDRFTVLIAAREGAGAVAEALAAGGVQALSVADSDEAPASLLAASDAVICSPCGSMLWEAPAGGVPMIAIDPATPMERSSVDLLATVGAAVVARDCADAVRRAAYLAADAARAASMARDSAAIGRPLAARAVCERALREIA